MQWPPETDLCEPAQRLSMAPGYLSTKFLNKHLKHSVPGILSQQRTPVQKYNQSATNVQLFDPVDWIVISPNQNAPGSIT